MGFGEKGHADLKAHPFFAEIDWEVEKNKPIA
jgi:hypothetical protein